MKDLLQRIKKHLIIIGVIFLLCLLLGLFIHLKSSGSREKTLSDPIKKGTIMESVYGVGTVTAKHTYALKVGITATIQFIYVAEGDEVKKGQNLIKLDGMQEVKAPFDGTITYFPSKVGETVFAQGVILNLVNLKDRYLIVSLEQRAAIRVRPGQRAKVSFENMREQEYSGVVEAIYSNRGQFLVRIRADQLPAQILPDMVADVSIGIAQHQEVKLIPVAALEQGKVFVHKKNGERKSIPLKIGLIDGSMAEVLSGEIEEGDQVILPTRAKP